MLKQTEYSNAFSVNPTIIDVGEQFDIILDDAYILNIATQITLQVLINAFFHQLYFYFNLI